MLNTIQKTVCALAVLSATALPALAESVDVRVVGTITPTACTPSLSGGGTVDYGNIQPSSLAKDTYTVLDEKQVDFSITCDAPAKVAFKVTNMRPGTLAGVTENSQGTGIPPVTMKSAGFAAAGLGLDGGAKIGGYTLTLGQLTTDSKAADPLNDTGSNKVSWVKAVPNANLFYPNANFSAATPGTLIPVAFTTLTGKLGVQAYINKASELDLTKPVVLDGLTTLELVYL